MPEMTYILPLALSTMESPSVTTIFFLGIYSGRLRTLSEGDALGKAPHLTPGHIDEQQSNRSCPQAMIDLPARDGSQSELSDTMVSRPSDHDAHSESKNR
jgi:hypothetical protein